MRFKLNKMSHDRKTLYTILGVMVVSIFTLSIAYAVLSATLNISGWADIASSSWDIHFANVKVTRGSVEANKPQLTGSTSLSFNASLANQGDYYEFTVDVVNDGKIDAMVDYIYKYPELDEEQRKYLKYEVTYENGQSIESRQNLRKQSSATIKVRIEYRSDIAESDLVVTPTSLSFNIALVYIQSDGSGVDVPTGGGDEPSVGGSSGVTVVSGDGTQVGDEICIGEECFYVISSTEDTITMLTKYNLYVGYRVEDYIPTELENPTGIQDETAIGSYWDDENSTVVFPSIGTVPFSEYNEISYFESDIKKYVDNYSDYLSQQGVTSTDSRIITMEELERLGCSEIEFSCASAPQWVYSTSYWTMSTSSEDERLMLYVQRKIGVVYHGPPEEVVSFGVRPVITISRNYL